MMNIQQYRKKPVIIEAMQWDGSLNSGHEIMDFLGLEAISIERSTADVELIIHMRNLQDDIKVCPGDFIVKTAINKIYRIKSHEFELQYELME